MAKKNVNPSYISGKQLPASYFSGMGKGAKSPSRAISPQLKTTLPKVRVPMRSGSPTKKGATMLAKAVKKLAM